MENKDISITNILVDNEDSINDEEFKANPFQRDVLMKRSTKTKKDLNKFLFNTAQLKINKKLTINNTQSKIKKFEYIDKKNLLSEEKENVDNVTKTNNTNKEKEIPDNIIDDSTIEFKDAKEHYSVIIPDESEIIDNNNTTESNELQTENILDSELLNRSINNVKEPNEDDISKKNEVNSKRIETIMNSLGNLNENVKKRIISRMSKSPGLINNNPTSIRHPSTYESLLKKYHNVNQFSSNSLKKQISQPLLRHDKNEKEIIEIKDEPTLNSNIPFNKNYRNLSKKYSDSNISGLVSSQSKLKYKKSNDYMKYQNFSGSLIARRTSLIQNKNNRNNNSNTQNNVNSKNSLDNDNLTLTINDKDKNLNNIKLSKSKIKDNNIDNNNLLYKTPSNSSKNRNSLLNSSAQEKSNFLKPNFTKSLDRGRTSYLQFLNDENTLNKKDTDTLSVKSTRSLKYEDFLKSPVNTPSKIGELLINDKDTSPLLLSQNYKLPTTAFSANSFFEKSKDSYTKVNEKINNDNASPLLLKSLHEEDGLLQLNNSTISNNHNNNMEFEMIKDNDEEKGGIVKELTEEKLIEEDLLDVNLLEDNLLNDNLLDENLFKEKLSSKKVPQEQISNEKILNENLEVGKKLDEKIKNTNENPVMDNDNISLRLGFYSPILNNEHKNDHQRNFSEISQPLNSRLNVNSPTSNIEENKTTIYTENHSRKRPSDSHEKDEGDQSLIIISDSSSLNKSERKTHYKMDNDIVSNKKSKIKSPRNSILNSQASTSSTSRINYGSIYTENQIEEIKRKLTEKYEKQLEDAKKDCMEWEQKCIESNNKHKEIENVLEEYEVTITRMIKDSQKEKERQELRINELLEERTYLQESSEIMETSFKELRLKFEEFKTQNEIFSKNEELMKQTITSLQNDVLLASQRYEQIKSHAEEKLEM
ncbi:hypothetical protein PIROE2DRAFT_6647 [Piromyces sp. E2]|nr:hypothetical protein PIROE2DRAFT_6647 [Piromyces sp. E2]|eukprot:OUM66210.1 hypothetical protein PIROE2DRAFT_6647 [Piromyces sp. E2]